MSGLSVEAGTMVVPERAQVGLGYPLEGDDIYIALRLVDAAFQVVVLGFSPSAALAIAEQLKAQADRLDRDLVPPLIVTSSS